MLTAILAAIAEALARFGLGALFKRPSAATQAAVVTTELEATRAEDRAVQEAVAARDRVAAEQLREPDPEAAARAPDPYSRD